MKKTFFILKIFITSCFCLLLCACSSFWDKDNTPTPTPLVSFNQELKVHDVWNTRANAGSGSNYLRIVPALNDRAIYTASEDGTVVATDKFNGKTLWKKSTSIKIT